MSTGGPRDRGEATLDRVDRLADRAQRAPEAGEERLELEVGRLLCGAFEPIGVSRRTGPGLHSQARAAHVRVDAARAQENAGPPVPASIPKAGTLIPELTPTSMAAPKSPAATKESLR